MSPRSARRAFVFFCSLAPILASISIAAQEEVVPRLRGEVRVGDVPLSEGMVVLHQVSADVSGEIDSVRIGPDGTFQIRLPHVPDHASRPEVFFASVEYRGLLYFGPPVTEAVQLDSLYLIQAYDTVSVPPGGTDLPISTRNLFLEKTTDGWIATDVFALSNPGDRTLFSPAEGAVWSYPLPVSAVEFELGQADLAPDAVRFSEGRMELYAPLPPGERFLMVRYRIQEANFLLPLPGRTGRLEVLIREPAPSVELHPLALTTPVELEPGNVFRHFSAEGLQDVEVTAEVAPDPWSIPAEWLALVLAGLLGAAGVVGFRKRSRGAPEAEPARPEVSRNQILLHIASLDEEFQAKEAPSDGARRAYEAERSRLLSDLKNAR